MAAAVKGDGTHFEVGAAQRLFDIQSTAFQGIYDISRDGKTVLNKTEEAGKVPNAGAQVTIQKQMPLRSLAPGRYTVAIQVKDKVKNQTIPASAAFELR